MGGEHIVVVDLTGATARACVLSDGPACGASERPLSIPWRVAVRSQGDELITLAGGRADGLTDQADTLVFDQLHADLQNIEDVGLQALIIGAFWDELSRALCDGRQEGGARAAVYFVVPHLYPSTLLDQFRAASAVPGPARLCGFIHEAAALVLGFVRSPHFARSAGADSAITLCLASAREDGEAELLFFDHVATREGRHRIFVHNFFRTTCANLSLRLRIAEQTGDFRATQCSVAALASPELLERDRAAFDEALHTFCSSAASYLLAPADVRRLKLDGAAHAARCCLGGAPVREEYLLETAFHLGMRASQDRFYPILTKEKMSELTRFPHTVRQSFKSTGGLESGERLELYCGLSDLIEDAVLLCSTVIPPRDASARSEKPPADITVSLTLDALGSGEVSFEVLPEHEVIGRTRFTLPGLIV